MSRGGAEMRSEMGPAVEQVVSERAWASFPGLELAALRWAELAGPEAASLVVSAVTIGMDWVSVRVSRTDGDVDGCAMPVDWIEWLAPMTYKGACQSALDHFCCRALDAAATSLKGRTGALKGVADFPPVPAPAAGPDPRKKDEPTMASKKPAPAAAPAPKKAMPAPRPETRSGPAATRATPTPTPAKAKSMPMPTTAKAKSTRASKPAAKPESGRGVPAPAASPPKRGRK
jgi:hypothetical protein